MALRRILIANRGEIALRVMRTCAELGIETVLAASDADLDSLPARRADRVVCIGPGPAAQSYLSIPAILHAAAATGADAIHPGYGFLAENAAFARACKDHDIVFIGPTAAQLESVGDKLKARALALGAGVAVVPGGAVSGVAEALEMAEAIGYPVLIKAVGGGGGRGMKRVEAAAGMEEAVSLAVTEAAAAFGDPRVYVERFIAQGRHVEVQVLGDGQRVIHLGDRDCSVQRRFQKLIEEAPAPGLPEAVRQRLHQAALGFAGRISYVGLGTVEFLHDAARQEFYFLEMNARIQVEHPVTEMVTGVDLVAEQIAIAGGAPLGLVQSDISITGHAMECRINAEDPDNDFQPSPGTVSACRFPAGQGVRVDTHMEAGARVPPFYDSLIAKVIAHGASRAEAVSGMVAALESCRVEGVATNISLHLRILADQEFATGGVDTGFLTRFLEPAAQTRKAEAHG